MLRARPGTNPGIHPAKGDQSMWKILCRVGLLALVVAAGTTGSLAGAATPAAASVPGIAVYTNESPLDSYDKTVTVKCPDDKKVIDAGGYIEDGDGKVILDDVFPDPNLGFVDVTGKETDTFAGKWRVHAYATCATEPDGLEWIRAQTASNDVASKHLTVACSEDKTVLGSGYTITGGDGEVWVDEAVPNGGDNKAATHVSLIGVRGDEFSGDWNLDGFVICANALPGQRVVSAVNGPNSSDKGTAVGCGNGQVVTGSTAEVKDGTGTVVPVSDYAGSTSLGTVRGEENTDTGNDWSIKVFVYCADA
jgi:hypothetical protein